MRSRRDSSSSDAMSSMVSRRSFSSCSWMWSMSGTFGVSMVKLNKNGKACLKTIAVIGGASVRTPIDRAPAYPEMAVTADPLPHGRMDGRAAEPIGGDAPGWAAIGREREGNFFAAAAGTAEARPF